MTKPATKKAPSAAKQLPTEEDKQNTPKTLGAAMQDAGTHLRVACRPGIERFCRAGLCFGQEPVDLPLSEMDEARFAQLMAEPNLLTGLVDLPLEAAQPT